MKLAKSINKKDQKTKFLSHRSAPESFCQNLLDCKLLNYTSTKSAFSAFSVFINFKEDTNSDFER
jgi:hypothetical protein